MSECLFPSTSVTGSLGVSSRSAVGGANSPVGKTVIGSQKKRAQQDRVNKSQPVDGDGDGVKK